MRREATVTRKTNETDISVTINLDGTGKADIDTGIGFFDHMLSGFARHGFFDLTVRCKGDLAVDTHHSIEDVGIVLGLSIAQALGDKAGIARFGERILPMDDALVLCAIDLSGRPYLAYDLQFTADKCGEMDTQMAKEFFYALSYAAAMNLHLKQFSGENDHHIMEAAFKAFGKALDYAVTIDARVVGVPSTKGML